jgi:hypothetical protein
LIYQQIETKGCILYDKQRSSKWMDESRI